MKKLKLIAKVIAIIIICLIGFVGIYLPWQKPLQMNNLVKEYSLGKDFTGYREITLEVSDASKVLDSNNKEVGDTDSYDDSTIQANNYTKSEEKVNSAESLNEGNYEKSKSIIEKRMIDFGVQDYNLSMNKETGKIYIQIPENSNTDRIISNITEIGGVELKDSEDDTKVLLTNDNFKKATMKTTGTIDTGKLISLNIIFNKEGKRVLKDLSENEYKKIDENKDQESSDEENADNENHTEEEHEAENEENAQEGEENKEETKQKKVALYVSGNVITTTEFEKAINDGTIGLVMGGQYVTDEQTANELEDSARAISSILNNGILPLKYKVVGNKYIQSEINKNTLRNIILVIIIVFALLLIYMIIKYKAKGILIVLSYLGFVSLYTLIVRLFNVTITMESIIGAVIILGLNYLINMRLIENIKDKKKYYQTYLDIIMKAIPILVISIVFVFMPVLGLSSIGMIMFWGIVLMLAYNITVTKHLTD